MGKDDVYFVIGTLLGILALLGMDWKLVWGRLSKQVRRSRKREVLLLTAVIGSLALSSIGWYRAEHPKVDVWKFPTQETIYAKSYINETVELDGKVFDHCHFENVKLLYHGLGPVSIVQSDFKGQVWVGSDNIAIQNFGIANAELEKLAPLVRLHSWVQMDKNGSPTSVR